MPVGVRNIVAKPLVGKLMCNNVCVGHTNGSHSLMLHTARKVSITHAVFLLPERIPAIERRKIINHNAYTIEVGFVSRVKCGCIYKEILNEHGVRAAGKMHVRSVFRILCDRYRNKVVSDWGMCLPV